MNYKTIIIVLALATMQFFTACDDEENIVAKPEITILELGEGDGHGNNHTATVGGELHMEIEIIAEGKIDEIRVILHIEHEGDHKSVTNEEDWELDTTYIGYSGLKNTDFHQHLEIADWAEPGEYHFDFIVTDMEGNQSRAESDVEIIEE